jgi:hypothetical protein
MKVAAASPRNLKGRYDAEDQRAYLPRMQWNGLRFGDAASGTGPKNLPREMRAMQGQGQDHGRQLRRRLFAIRWEFMSERAGRAK